MKIEPLADSVQKISDRTPIGSLLKSADWQRVPLALRERAFFSAGVESVRFLSDARQGIQDILGLAREQTRGGDALIDRSSLIAKLREVAEREGIPVDPKKAGTIEDIRSRARLGLIIDTQLAQAREFARWKAEQDPDILDAFPAQELVRIESRDVPRDWPQRWSRAGGKFYEGRMIAAKNDPIWQRISRFGTPYPPFDFFSGMGVEDIDRDTAEQLGVIAPGQIVPPAETDFNAALEASARGLSDKEKQQLRGIFGNQIDISGDRVKWRGKVLPPLPPTPPPPAPSRPVVPPPPPVPTTPAPAVNFDIVEPALMSLADEWAELDRRIKAPGQTGPQLREAFLRMEQIKEQTHKLIEVPETERKQVTFRKRKRKSKLQPKAEQGAEIFSRFVHPDYVPQDLEISALSGRRAYYTASDRAIHIRQDTPLRTVIHEITHDIEFQHPAVLAETKAFLRTRAAGQPARSLRSLTGISAYKWGEIAYEDEWQARGGSHYMGKVYPDATEILTMGIERLIDSPMDFYTQDPDYFKFLVQTLRKW